MFFLPKNLKKTNLNGQLLEKNHPSTIQVFIKAHNLYRQPQTDQFQQQKGVTEAGADGAAHRQQSVLQRTLKVAEAKVQAAQAQRREAQRQKRLAEKAEKEIHNQFKDVMINKTKQKVYTQDIMRQIEENKAAMKDLQLIYAQEENEKQKLQQQVRLLEKSRLHDIEQWEKFSKKKQGGNF
ncbi:MAG: hypothetical protein EZS28_021631 [Streblomastix strix]|uniref:Uncharacterized protein n=1 Tax=Streblomastix strix TaxID=222440 RepID=A0A5J4VK40_9EUKA|nr:MAG: hypothetical protein EZS28_021631 [Streblomastix strix]